ncbi:MAG: clan AA aspartic protease [Microcystis sp. M048S1]|uniref:clan AA aspartic protease n=1 Tax=unclassified Microcystis TaxID=2643300 RepID=UPI001195F86F|nr:MULTISPECIES: clan AA aspartic protease [unclassified Microcystis]MCA2900317.1 clan AA aspartic protease [Microcystis sp. M035S1]MCA6549972.1 clan AA aspartic protease [Pseudanabaena sp. M152S2SP2A07QC]MCA2721648.1 clan AA aspartic protease [Microcystis sp. M176S2]MCA2776480.1 clan AA aspartic protease [Microcystis sp. M135S2]MCA2777970.1 clan AA aspartic protease [Microcystis sp. M136S2]
MMYGSVNQSCEAILPVVVKNDTRTQLVDAVIDTGFSGFLTLPSSIIGVLDLTWKGRDIATFGDGSYCIFDVYIARVIWDGQYRTIDINKSETVPLIGMGLLRGYDLRIQAIEGGSVTIDYCQFPTRTITQPCITFPNEL